MGIEITRPEYHLGRIPAGKGKTYPVEILTPDEVRALLAQCSETASYGIRHRALIVMLYRTGLRYVEALALQLKDIDLQVYSVAVLHGKGDRRRTAGIDPQAAQVVQAWMRRRQLLDLSADAPLFCTLRGGPMSQPHVRTVLHRLARRAGIDKRVQPHGLRHTHAYELMNEGVVVSRASPHPEIPQPGWRER